MGVAVRVMRCREGGTRGQRGANAESWLMEAEAGRKASVTRTRLRGGKPSVCAEKTTGRALQRNVLEKTCPKMWRFWPDRY